MGARAIHDARLQWLPVASLAPRDFRERITAMPATGQAGIPRVSVPAATRALKVVRALTWFASIRASGHHVAMATTRPARGSTTATSNHAEPPVEKVKVTTRLPFDLKRDLDVRAATLQTTAEVLHERALRAYLATPLAP